MRTLLLSRCDHLAWQVPLAVATMRTYLGMDLAQSSSAPPAFVGPKPPPQLAILPPPEPPPGLPSAKPPAAPDDGESELSRTTHYALKQSLQRRLAVAEREVRRLREEVEHLRAAQTRQVANAAALAAMRRLRQHRARLAAGAGTRGGEEPAEDGGSTGGGAAAGRTGRGGAELQPEQEEKVADASWHSGRAQTLARAQRRRHGRAQGRHSKLPHSSLPLPSVAQATGQRHQPERAQSESGEAVPAAASATGAAAAGAAGGSGSSTARRTPDLPRLKGAAMLAPIYT